MSSYFLCVPHPGPVPSPGVVLPSCVPVDPPPVLTPTALPPIPGPQATCCSPRHIKRTLAGWPQDRCPLCENMNSRHPGAAPNGHHYHCSVGAWLCWAGLRGADVSRAFVNTPPMLFRRFVCQKHPRALPFHPEFREILYFVSFEQHLGAEARCFLLCRVRLSEAGESRCLCPPGSTSADLGCD